MAYAIAYNGIEGQAGLYARVQRKFDGMWWSESDVAWVPLESVVCDIALVESLTAPGAYSGVAGLSPAKGGIYTVSVYTSSARLLMSTDCPYLSTQRTVLEIINNVQRGLRLPQTGEVAFSTSAHAQLLLGFLNKISDLIMEHSPAAELKVSGSFQIVAGMPYYPISLVNFPSGIDVINRLQIGIYEPLVPICDEQMSEYRRSVTEQGQPLYYRPYSRQGGTMIVEVAPTPDKTYTVSFNGFLRVSRLTASTDIPVLDPDTIELGMLFLAKEDQGEEFQTDLAAFQAKNSLHNPNGGVAGDVDFL